MTHRFVVRMSEEQFSLLREMANINCTSINNLVNVAISELLDMYEMIDNMEENANGKNE